VNERRKTRELDKGILKRKTIKIKTVDFDAQSADQAIKSSDFGL